MRAHALAACLCLAALAPAAAEPAKAVFGRAEGPSAGPAAAYGSYARGCIAGAIRLAETGPGWQAMRLSRNRNWGHPEAIAFVRRLSERAQGIGWPGLYIGDISQPLGGPMTSGHRSHQIGLDIDIWFRRPSTEPLSLTRREEISSTQLVDRRAMRVNANWTPTHGAILRAAAEDPAVARIFVHAAIKRQLCREAGAERGWLRRIRAWYGHDSHFHVRLACPPDALGCENQAPPPPGDGCGAELDWWFTEEARSPKPKPGAKPRGPLALRDLPAACRALVRR